MLKFSLKIFSQNLGIDREIPNTGFYGPYDDHLESRILQNLIINIKK